MNLYSVELKLCATAYIKANSKTEALAVARKLLGESPAILDSGGDVPVSGGRYTDPHLPDVSLSPAMTIHGPWGSTVELSAENLPQAGRARYHVTVRYRTNSGCNAKGVDVEATSMDEALVIATAKVRRQRGVIRIDGGHCRSPNDSRDSIMTSGDAA